MDGELQNQTRLDNLNAKHCIFQCGDAVFALPATTIREVTIVPTVVPVPLSHPALHGIGNLRSEFLPVINLEPLVGNQARLSSDKGQLLVIDHPLGCWSIAIDKVISIDGIETHIDADQRNEIMTSVMLGTANYAGNVISVLDFNSLQRIAQQTIENQWSGQEQPIDSRHSSPSSEFTTV